jgi:hypothetical protein
VLAVASLLVPALLLAGAAPGLHEVAWWLRNDGVSLSFLQTWCARGSQPRQSVEQDGVHLPCVYMTTHTVTTGVIISDEPDRPKTRSRPCISPIC